MEPDAPAQRGTSEPAPSPGCATLVGFFNRRSGEFVGADAGEIASAGLSISRLGTCQDHFFSVSQQDIDGLKASILEQANPPHHGQPVANAILVVRWVAEEAIIIAY